MLHDITNFYQRGIFIKVGARVFFNKHVSVERTFPITYVVLEFARRVLAERSSSPGLRLYKASECGFDTQS